MRTPHRLEISNGTVANDGTGDTLYDATTKINNNFRTLWSGVYNDEVATPGRTFEFSRVTDSSPDSGQFTMTYADISEDSEAFVRISRLDQEDKAFAGSPNLGKIAQTKLSLWSLDSGTLDEWSLVNIFYGSATYATDHWEFGIDSSIATGSLDSGTAYYLGLEGAW